MKTLRIFSFLVLSLNVAFAEGEKTFLGAIPVQYVTPSKEVVLDMHRFYQPGAKAKLDFATKDDVDLAFDAASLQLHARTKKSGLFDVVLKSGEATTVLTLAAEPEARGEIFVCREGLTEAEIRALHGLSPEERAAKVKVFIAGSFNGWSKDKTPMGGPSMEGEYSVELPLGPGRYTYKFVVNDRWVLDSGNPQMEDNGMGDKNSVVVVEKQLKNPVPVIYADRWSGRSLVAHAVSPSPIQRASAVFEGNDGSISIPARISGDQIDVSVPEKQTGFVRLIASAADGMMITNVVRCPIGDAKKFRWQDAVMYYAFTDRFADGDKSNDHPVENPNVAPPANYHGGDLRGVRDKIDNGWAKMFGGGRLFPN